MQKMNLFDTRVYMHVRYIKARVPGAAMHRATSHNLAVSGQAFGASLDVVPLTSTEASSAVHNPYIVGGLFGRKKEVHVHVHHYTNNTSPNNDNRTSLDIISKNRLDADPQLTQDISQIRIQSDGLCYGVYLNTLHQKFQVGILLNQVQGTAAGCWVKTYHGGNLTRDAVTRAILMYNENTKAHEWSAPGTTLLDHWYWYKNAIPNLGYHRTSL